MILGFSVVVALPIRPTGRVSVSSTYPAGLWGGGGVAGGHRTVPEILTELRPGGGPSVEEVEHLFYPVGLLRRFVLEPYVVGVGRGWGGGPGMGRGWGGGPVVGRGVGGRGVGWGGVGR